MRAVVAGLLAAFFPAVALAQAPAATAPAPAAPAASAPAPAAPATAPAPRRRASADITRDDYIERAVERAKRNAERRFDAMDTNHDGVLTADERRAYREAHSRSRATEDEPAPAAAPAASAPPAKSQ